MPDTTGLNRRDLLSLIAVTAAGGALISTAAYAQEAGATTGTTESTLMPGADVCVITPEVTEGPYYFDPALERVDITEGRPGIATRIRLQIVDALCQPLAGARVDIWHCDASGVYSGYANQTDGVDTTGETFMRGTLFAGSDGIVEFATVYPGWYRGRTTHVHFKVFLDEANVLTGQIFFPDALSQYIYEHVEAYDGRGSDRDTRNTNDNIAAQATRASFAYVKELEDAYLVAMIIGVDPSAQSTNLGMGAPAGNRPLGPPAGGSAPSTGTAPAAEAGTMIPGQ
ncbi:MAG: intradiol ring-cleavage dioxygenase [Devosia sp.]|nr:intradiol ring-cleavage dioxygenase [Devosia sp.]